MSLIKKSILKKMFLKQGARIGNKTLIKFSSSIQKTAENLIGKAARQAKLSGRKTIRPEDMS